MVIVIVAGHVGADPETRYSASGQKIITFRIASNSKRQGKEETTWWRITVFGDRFDKLLSYVKKGSALVVTGEMSTNIWTDKDGNQHIGHEIIADSIKFSPFGRTDRPEQGQGAPQGNYSTPQYSPPPSPANHAPQPAAAAAWTPPPSFNAPTPDFSFGGNESQDDTPF